ncbi:hypothetical protein XarbCFBP8130_15030 [Xanthomonas arboricola]|nr:hypothetical protein XarbCFBP8130_15030 [Xanthomonas arboricola]
MFAHKTWTFYVFSSPVGRRCPEGADEGTGEALWSLGAGGLHLVPSPQPLSRGERSLRVPSPVGRRCLEEADEGTGEALWSLGAGGLRLRPLTPTPLPGERGFGYFFTPGKPSFSRCA